MKQKTMKSEYILPEVMILEVEADGVICTSDQLNGLQPLDPMNIEPFNW